MDWSRSYSSDWRVYRVNRDTWADAERATGIDSVDITRTADGALLESGSMTVAGGLAPDYYRIVMTAEQSGSTERVDVATLLFGITGGSIDYGITEGSAEGRSVLYPASVSTIVAGEFVPKKADGAEYAAGLLRKAINAPVVVEGSFELNENLVHEIGSSVLDAVWSVLNAGGFVMQIDGKGVVHIRPKPTEPDLIIDNASKGIMLNGIDFTSDISEIPNRYVVIDDGNITIATNDSDTSDVSTVSRGFEVDSVDTSPTPINGETYGEYANRRLHELSVLETEHSYSREFAPEVFVYSIVKASIAELSGDLRVKSQSIKCGHGITVDEKATEEVDLWQ